MSSFSSFLTITLIFGVAPVLIFYLSRFVTRTALTTANTPQYLPRITPVLLATWYISAVIVGYYIKSPLSPAGLIQIVIPMLLGILIIFLAKSATRLLEKMPPQWLIGLQVYRSAGFLFLYLYFHDNFISRGFALSAGTGDLLVGLSALPIAAWVRSARKGYMAAAIIWNIAGITDLVLAPVSARTAGFQGITSYPLVVVPLFLGPPLGIVLHLASLRNLHLRFRTNKS